MSDPKCPFCGRSITTPADLTRDHIFVDALGAHQTVPACRTCNSQIGTEVEGALMRPHGLLNLVRQVVGKGHAIPGTVGPNATPVSYDLTTSELRFKNPVTTSSDGQTRDIRVSGSPEQIRQSLRQQGLSASQVDDLMAGAEQRQFEDPTITTVLPVDVETLHRLAAKVALAALAFVDPDGFANTDLARSLRDILWVRVRATEVPTTGQLPELDEMSGNLTEVHGRPAVKQLGPPAGSSQVAFVAAGAAGCIVIVHLAGHELPGIALSTGQLSYDSVALLVRDAVSRALVIRLGDELEAALA